MCAADARGVPRRRRRCVIVQNVIARLCSVGYLARSGGQPPRYAGTTCPSNLSSESTGASNSPRRSLRLCEGWTRTSQTTHHNIARCVCHASVRLVCSSARRAGSDRRRCPGPPSAARPAIRRNMQRWEPRARTGGDMGAECGAVGPRGRYVCLQIETSARCGRARAGEARKKLHMHQYDTRWTDRGER